MHHFITSSKILMITTNRPEGGIIDYYGMLHTRMNFVVHEERIIRRIADLQ